MAKMSLMVVVPAAAMVATAVAVAWRFSWFLMPLAWTGEPAA